MMTIAVTGGIGSGKSEVCRYLESLGIPVYDADSRTRRLYNIYPSMLRRVEEEFGTSLRDSYGFLDRGKLASIVFADRRALDLLESIVHPYVFDDFVAWRASCKEEVVIMESAIILQKTMFHPLVDKVILVDAPQELRIARVMARDNCSRDAVLKRIAAQTYASNRVDAVIVNDSDVETLHRRVDELLARIKENR